MQDDREPRPDLDELIAQQDRSLENLTAIDYEFLGYQDAVRGDIRPEMKYNEAYKKGWIKARHPDIDYRLVDLRLTRCCYMLLTFVFGFANCNIQQFSITSVRKPS